MKSSAAAFFKSFVLPAGVTSGTRIVFDGVNGKIVFYNASNDAILTLDSATGAITAVNPTDGSQVIVNSGDAAEITFVPRPVVGQTFDDGFIYTDEQADGSGVAAYMAFQSPAVAGGEPAFIYLSGPGPVTMASFIQTISNYFQIFSDDISFGAHNNASTNMKVNGNHVVSEVAYQETTTDSGIFTAATTVDSITVALKNGRSYDVVWDGQFGSSAAGDTVQVSLLDSTGGTTLRRSRLTIDRVTDPWPLHLRGTRFVSGATGNRTFTVQAVRAAGAGNITRYGTTANGGPACFQVLEVA